MSVLTAAYGRVYKTEAEVKEDYCSGKDFIFHDPSSRWDGKLCSCRDFPNESVELRYGKFDQHCTTVVKAKTKVTNE